MSNRNEDPLTRGFTMLVAVGALAFGAVAALMNSERTRQMRQDLEGQINDLSGRLDRTLQERRPEIEDAIQKGRRAAVDSLEKAKGVVEQGADKAHEYVQRASVKVPTTGSGTTEQPTDETASAALKPGTPEFSGESADNTGEATRRFDDGGSDGDNVGNNPGY